MNAIELIEILKENPDFIVTLQNKIEKQEIEIEELKDKLGIQNHSDNSLLKAVSKIKEQAKEIEQFRFVLRNLTLATSKKIVALEEQLEDCTCQGGHSEAYLKAKGRKITND